MLARGAMLRLAWIGLLPLALVACAGSATDPPLGASRAAIVGGKPAPKDTAVALVIIDHPPSTSSWIGCTGTVVSLHVVLTAAHCILDNTIADGYRFRLFLGDDLNDPTQENDPTNYVAVVEADPNPVFAIATASTKGGDVGVLIVADPLTPTPIPLQRSPLGPDTVGRSVRIIGYGAPQAGDTIDVARLGAETKISAVTATLIDFMGSPNTCEGDSGGPTLLKNQGVEYLAGVHSGGTETDCMGVGFESRVDVSTSFIDSFIDSLDSGFLPNGSGGGGGSSSAGGANAGGGGAADVGAGGGGGRPKDTAGGCAIAPPSDGLSGGALALMLGAAAWSRRRKRARS